MLVWSEKMSVHVDYIDQQHKKIIELINEVDRIYELKKSGQEISLSSLEKVIDELVLYTQQHFADEEEILERHSYRELERHKEIHRHLVSQVEALRTKFKDLGLEVVPILLKFLNVWLKEHILGIDMRYSNLVGKRETP